jgi:hypothetical protein
MPFRLSIADLKFFFWGGGGVKVVVLNILSLPFILLWAKCVIVVVVLKCMRTLLDECFFVAQHDVGPFKSVNVSVSDFDFSLNIVI